MLVRRAPEFPRRKSTRRGRRRNVPKEIFLYYNNVNGFRSKKHSICKIVEGLGPDIVALCETKRPDQTGNRVVSKDILKGYDVLERNVKQGQEGLLIGVRIGSYVKMQEVTESEWKNILTIQIEYPNFTARIILTHAPQETDKAEDRENFYEEMMTQVERGETSGDVVVVVGDFNARIESHDGMIKGTSSNGKLATQIITDHDLSVCNFDAKAEGKWTRLRNNKDGSVDASTIDYILISNKVAHTITEFSVDESKIYCPYREKLEKGEKKLV